MKEKLKETARMAVMYHEHRDEVLNSNNNAKNNNHKFIIPTTPDDERRIWLNGGEIKLLRRLQKFKQMSPWD